MPIFWTIKTALESSNFTKVAQAANSTPYECCKCSYTFQIAGRKQKFQTYYQASSITSERLATNVPASILWIRASDLSTSSSSELRRCSEIKERNQRIIFDFWNLFSLLFKSTEVQANTVRVYRPKQSRHLPNLSCAYCRVWDWSFASLIHSEMEDWPNILFQSFFGLQDAY